MTSCSIDSKFIEIFRANLHEGIIRDAERQLRRRAENIYQQQQQLELTKELKKREEEKRNENSENS